ncbi:hypothetical protein NQZ68_029200 [Dissostichus eleginoides]|nr:hypothetical protein NQZ68_029200 [Dissostichus eleginoides]
MPLKHLSTQRDPQMTEGAEMSKEGWKKREEEREVWRRERCGGERGRCGGERGVEERDPGVRWRGGAGRLVKSVVIKAKIATTGDTHIEPQCDFTESIPML